LLIYIYGKAGI